jgi:hypothetical protein
MQHHHRRGWHTWLAASQSPTRDFWFREAVEDLEICTVNKFPAMLTLLVWRTHTLRNINCVVKGWNPEMQQINMRSVGQICPILDTIGLPFSVHLWAQDPPSLLAVNKEENEQIRRMRRQTLG